MNEKLLLTSFVLNYPFLWQDNPDMNNEEMSKILTETKRVAMFKWAKLPDCSSCRTNNGNFCPTGDCWYIITAKNVCGCFAKGVDANGPGVVPGDPPKPKAEIIELDIH